MGVSNGPDPDAPTAYRKVGDIPAGDSITGDGMVGRTVAGEGKGFLAAIPEAKLYDNTEGVYKLAMGSEGFLEKTLDGGQGQINRRLEGEKSVDNPVKADKPFIEPPLKLTDRGGL